MTNGLTSITTADGRVDIKAGHGPDGSWEIAVAAPHPRLRPGVMGYRGIRLDLETPRRRLEAPIGAATLMFGFDEPLRISRSGLAPTSLVSVYSGPTTTAFLAEHTGRLSGVEVTLMPWAAFTLFGTPQYELTDRVLDPDELPHTLGGNRTGGRAGGRWGSVGELSAALAALPTWTERFRLLDDVFTWWSAAGTPSSARVVNAWAELVRSRGALPVARLAEHVGWSVRQLENRFREQIGLGPKVAARVLRLARARKLLAAGRSQAETAALCGFYDQSHLSSEFKAMTGFTPREFTAARRQPPDAPGPDRVPGEATSLVLAPAQGTR
ncbi:helix-turn-helix transcriptional regulator [Streptomyces sp. NPDC005925]|uniref:helix-turn-helix domain-containing protein n=1 Tax=Streptomyces sp. NPDC005925 TaxID=3157172 RepID=UPI0033CA12ED